VNGGDDLAEKHRSVLNAFGSPDPEQIVPPTSPATVWQKVQAGCAALAFPPMSFVVASLAMKAVELVLEGF